MELFEAIRKRRSCRRFLPDSIPADDVGRILEAAIWAPSPANNQPWEFIVVTSPEIKARIADAAAATKTMLFEKSGWKWLDRYDVNFIRECPVLIVVLGDPQKSGAHVFLGDSIPAYQHACAAAVQNMLLAACALGLGSLWFTLFERCPVRRILKISTDLDPLSIVCLGKPAATPVEPPRQSFAEKTRYV
ncbi:MAG: nitroreductase family protein [Syntrophaceae bacterium]